MQKTTTQPKNIFDLITFIAQGIHENSDHENENILESMQTELEALGKQLGVDAVSAAIFVAIFENHCSQRSATMDDLARNLDISALQFYHYKKNIDEMVRLGLICINRNRRRRNIIRQEYEIESNVFNAIIDNKPIESKNAKDDSFDQFTLVQTASMLVEERDDNEMTTQNLFDEVSAMETQYPNIPMVQKLVEMVPDLGDRITFYEVCFDNTQEDDTSLSRVLRRIYDHPRIKITKEKSFRDNNNALLKNNLVEMSEDERFRGVELSLTDEGRLLFMGKNASIYNENLVAADRYAFTEKVGNTLFPDSRQTPKLEKLMAKIKKIESVNENLKFVKQSKKFIPKDEERMMFYVICQATLEHDGIELMYLLGRMYEQVHDRMLDRHLWMEEKHTLQRLGLAKISKGNIFQGVKAVLDEKGKKLFYEKDAKLMMKKSSNQLVTPDKIVAKQLFYEPELERQLGLLRESLQESSFQDLRKRLQEKSLPNGIAALFYGAPGTGKTESVFQIAKQTGRAIVHVDISQTKSCWFGESEKVIKQVFKDYKELCKTEKLTPILLFNEADAVFSKRKDSNFSNVAQTENAIQNIILEEIEKLDGILIATTNLANNLDGAFERRFLFKVQFNKPSTEAKKCIWQDKMSWLSDSEAEMLANMYDFSGGEIDNIVRKATMDEVIGGKRPDFESLKQLCQEERINQHSDRRIGYAI